MWGGGRGVGVSVCTQACTGTFRDQERALDFLELESHQLEPAVGAGNLPPVLWDNNLGSYHWARL